MLLDRLLERRRDQPAVPGKPEGPREVRRRIIDCPSLSAAWPSRPRGTAGLPAGADSRNCRVKRERATLSSPIVAVLADLSALSRWPP
eukprot:scaffold97254_cov61-Phaeocystis_antarctica.AAC.2